MHTKYLKFAWKERPVNKRFRFVHMCTGVLLALVALLAPVCSAVNVLGSIATWNTIPGFENSTRVWDRTLLQLAVQHEGSLAHVQRLIDKLNSGKPIVAVAFGSSMIHDYAGCWQNGLESLWQHGIVPNPMLYPNQGSHVPLDQNPYVWHKCSSGGFMEAFMHTINSTWPHAGHIMFNNGKGGACLEHIYKASCMSAYTPEQIDIAVLDTVTNVCAPSGAEVIIRNLLKRPSQPLVILASNGRTCIGSTTEPCMNCIRDHSKGNHSSPACAVPGVDGMYNRTFSDEWGRSIQPYNELAQYYNIPHININSAMYMLMNDPEVMTRVGAPNRLELASHFYIDSVHYRKDKLGTLLVADLLVAYLATALQKLDLLIPSERALLNYTMPRAVALQDASKIYYTKCYGMTLKDVISGTQRAGGPDQDEVKRMMDTAGPGDTFQGFAEAHHMDDAQNQRLQTANLLAYPPLKVLESKGFELQLAYKGATGNIKLKPGWLANSSGAAFTFEVDTSFPDVPLSPGLPEVLITYVKSYNYWGKASFTCIQGCTCEPSLADANSGNVKTSVNHIHSFRASRALACQIRVEVLADTTSMGHQFKISNVVTRLEEAVQVRRRRRVYA